MSQPKHLERIVAKCRKLLARADKRTAGTCAGPSEAGWTSTILAIKQLKEMPDCWHRDTLEKFIIQAWREELL